jgi:Mrr N-terminal domain
LNTIDFTQPFSILAEIQVQVVQDAAEAGQAPDHHERDKTHRRSWSRESDMTITPQESFQDPIIRALGQAGGTLTTEAACAAVEQAVEHSLTQDDYLPVPSGTEPRWRNNVRWARKKMLGTYLATDSPRGIWQLSSQGWERFLQLENH